MIDDLLLQEIFSLRQKVSILAELLAKHEPEIYASGLIHDIGTEDYQEYRISTKNIDNGNYLPRMSLYSYIMKDNIIDFEENIPHEVSEVMCIHCKKRWIAVRPTVTLLKDIECPDCNQTGYVIETGQKNK